MPRLPAAGRIWFSRSTSHTRPDCSDWIRPASTQGAAQAGASHCAEPMAVAPGTWVEAMVASTQSASCSVMATSPVHSAASTAKAIQMIFFIAVVLR